MISDKMTEGLNRQINNELYSAYLYLSMESYAVSLGLNGVANWLRIQVQEEMSHAAKFIDYINQQSSRIALKGINEPPKDFTSAIDIFEKTVAHQKGVKNKIN